MLQVEQLAVSYGEAIALEDISITAEAGSVVSIIGANGAGKTTLVNTIAGILRPRAGRILLEGRDLATVAPHRISVQGVAIVPEGRRLFSKLSVLDNLLMGTYARRGQAPGPFTLEWILELFPVLGERRKQLAGTLSGGEQQMVAIGRALLAQPKLLLLDEPSLGLAPIVVASIFDVIRRINREAGVTILLVEQNVPRALELATKVYVLSNGRIVQEGRPEELAQDDRIRQAYLGQ